MKRSRVRGLAVLTASLLLASRAWPQQPAAAPSGFPPELDAYVTRAREAWAIPGLAVAVVRNDSVLVAKGYGVRELGRPGPVDENTVFDAASLTKSFTATSVAMLVDEGRMRWDDPVRRYLPGLELPTPALTAEVTVRDLLAHRTGLEAANSMWHFTAIDRAEVLRRMRFLAPAIPFRTGLVYSNLGYTVAGEAAAAAAASPWESLVLARIIRPLGLRRTVAGYADAAGMDNVASPHAVIDGAMRPIARENGGRLATAPAGAVQSSAADLARWLRFHLNRGTLDGRRYVAEEQMREMHEPQVVVPTTPAFRRSRQVRFFAGYGMGWQVMDYRGNPMLWHSGSGGGQLAYMAILPDKRLGVVVLLNAWPAAGTPVHGMIASRILDVFLGAQPDDPGDDGLTGREAAERQVREARERFEAGRIRGTRPSHRLEAYVDTYVDSLRGPIIVRLAGGRLTLQMGGGERAELENWHYDTFVARWHTPLYRSVFATRVVFSQDADGGVNGLAFSLGRDSVTARREAAR